jgi:iron complex outermembrane receptor protein
VVDLKAGYEFAGGITVEAGVRNLDDRLYEFTEGFPEPGRTSFVQFNVPWSL